MASTVQIRNLILGEGRPKICIPLTDTTKETLLSAVKDVTQPRFHCDLAEWRADFFEPLSAPQNAASDAAQPAAPSSLASLRRQRIERDAAQRQQLEEARRARVAALDAARRQQEETERQRAAARAEDDSRRAQEREEREAERAAEREEYNQRVKNLAAQLEAQMIENRRKRLEESNSNDDE